MNRPDSRTSENRARSSGMNGAYCALTSTSGITTARVYPRCLRRIRRKRASNRLVRAVGAGLAPTLQEAPGDRGDDSDDEHRDDVVDEPERLVELLPARPRRPAGAGEREAPERRPEERQPDV